MNGRRTLYGTCKLVSTMPDPGTPSDPTRVLALLWGPQTKTGRSGLSVKRIVRAAITLADQHGIEAVSMRRVADHLSVGTMSLYTHVPGKPELTELMIDTVYGELYGDADQCPRSPAWREGLTHVAETHWAMLHRHPWLLDIPTTRPVLGPNGTRKYDADLQVLDGIGLTDVEMDAALTLVLTHVEGSARLAINQTRERRNSGVTDEEWWTVNAPLLEQVMDARRFPVASRVGQAAGAAHGAAVNPDLTFRFGLTCLLDGLGVLLEGRRQA